MGASIAKMNFKSYEHAKNLLQQSLEKHVGVFAVVDARGRILAGNEELNRLFGESDVFEGSFSDLFSDGDQSLWNLQLSLALTTGYEQSVAIAVNSSLFHWSIQVPMGGQAAVVFGYEAALLDKVVKPAAHVLQVLPLGLLIFDEAGFCSSYHSQVSETLLEQSPLAGKHIYSLLFEPYLNSTELGNLQWTRDGLCGDLGNWKHLPERIQKSTFSLEVTYRFLRGLGVMVTLRAVRQEAFAIPCGEVA